MAARRTTVTPERSGSFRADGPMDFVDGFRGEAGKFERLDDDDVRGPQKSWGVFQCGV